jgi:hypothetical protein
VSRFTVPFVFVLTANVRIAPTAIRKIPTPSPTDALLRGDAQSVPADKRLETPPGPGVQ